MSAQGWTTVGKAAAAPKRKKPAAKRPPVACPSNASHVAVAVYDELARQYPPAAESHEYLTPEDLLARLLRRSDMSQIVIDDIWHALDNELDGVAYGRFGALSASNGYALKAAN